MKEQEKKSGFAYLKKYAAAFKGHYIVAVIFAILGVACSMIPYFAVSKMVYGLIQGIKEVSFYWKGVGLVALGFLLKVLCHNLSTTLSHKATFGVISEIRKQIANKLTRVPMGYLLDTPSGKFKNTMVEKVDSIEPTLAHVLPEMTSNLLVPVAIIIYLFSLDWRMALVSMVTLPIGAVCYMGMMKDYELKFGEYIAVGKHMNATAVEYINGIEVIKAFGQSTKSYKKFSEAIHANANYGLDWMRQCQVYFAMGIGIWPAVLIGVLPIGSIFYMQGSLSAEIFISIIILSLGIMGPLLAAIYFTDDIAKIGSVMQDIGGLLDEAELIRPKMYADLKGYEIHLNQVRFAYGDTEILHGIDLRIPEGSVTAFVGPSGGGKSTIAKLIASFWDVTSGEISIGGIPVNRIPSHQLMDKIAYVAQDNYLFDDTIMENIRRGRLVATNEEVIEAAKSAGCHEFILSLEKGYDTIAGGAGGHLSGGERQRIAIARAMLKNADIVILDEATAYTDPENEAIIQQAVAKLVEGKTLIVIAHRLSTIVDSDQIVVIEEGQIIDKGKHNGLLENCQLYQEMWQAHISAKDVA